MRLISIFDMAFLYHLAGNNAAANRHGEMDDDFQFTVADLVAIQQEAR